MCGSEGIDGRFILGFGRLCRLGLIFLTADMALWGAALKHGIFLVFYFPTLLLALIV